MKINKVLIIQTASIGDVILATPLIEKLHAFYPDAQIDFMLKKGIESLFIGHPYISNLIVWDKSNKKYTHLLDIINHNRDQKYDLIVNLQRFLSSGLMTVLSRARKTSGFNKNPLSVFFSNRIRHKIGDERSQYHETDRNLSLIEKWTDTTKYPIKLYPNPADFAKTSQYKTHQYICIAPASLWQTKEYPISKWIEFLKEVSDETYVYFLGATHDKIKCEQIIKASGHKNSLILTGKLSLLESAALMKDALMNFVNDSAPMHLASAVNAPTTAIFCSTLPSFGFGPLSENSVIVEVKEKLDCRPCGIHGLKRCPKKHFKCALNINYNELLSRL